MTAAVWTSFEQISNSSGVPYSGAKVNVYAAGTVTPLSLFSDETLSTPAANPIVCDSSGQHAMTYFSSANYKTSVTDSANVPLTNWSKDHIDPGVAVGTGALPVANGGTGATSAGSARTNLGAASDASVTTIASNVTTLQGYHAGTSALPIAAGTTAQRPGSPADYNLRGNTTTGSPEIYLGGSWLNVSLAPPVLQFQKLLIFNNAGTPNSKVDLTADAVTVVNAGNVAIRLNSVSLTIDCTTTGANGLDAGALANATWYYVYVIFNPTTGTTAGLMSASATSPTMPSGYTFKGRFGAFITNGSANFLRILQKGRRAQYVVTAASTTPNAVPVFAISSSSGSPSSGGSALAIGGYVPTAVASIIFGSLYVTGNSSVAILAPNGGYGGTGTTTNPPPIWLTAPGANFVSTTAGQPFSMMLESTNVFFACTGGGLYVSGWEDNI